MSFNPLADNIQIMSIPGAVNDNFDALIAGLPTTTDESAFTAGENLGIPVMAEDPTSGEILICQTLPGTRQLAVAIVSFGSNSCSANAIATIGTGSIQAIVANSNRKKLILQNIGTTRLYVLFGSGTASSSNFTFILPAGGSSLDGSSPIYVDTIWQGSVQWVSSSIGGQGIANDCS